MTLLVVLLLALAVAGLITAPDEADAQNGVTRLEAGFVEAHQGRLGPSGSSGPAENTIKGEVAVATLDSARGFSAQSMHGVTHFRLHVVGNAPFELHPQRSGLHACLGSDCVQTPDFDIAFFRDYGSSMASVGERHYNVGPEVGFVPHNADFAHVYLRTPGAVPDNIRGYSFVYLQGNPGSDQVPDWS